MKETTEPQISLRDYFAAKAINGMLSNPDHGCSHEDTARHAYRYADAMLAERIK